MSFLFFSVELLSASRFLVGLLLMGYASLLDLRVRRVKNIVWIMMGILGLAILEIQLLLEVKRWEHHLILIPSTILFLSAFWGEELFGPTGKILFRPLTWALYLIALIVILFQILMLRGQEAEWIYFLQLLTIPAMILVAYGLYQSGLLRGGADAKALMAIAILVPFYPYLPPLPLISPDPRMQPITNILFPFAFVVLLNATLLFLVAPLLFLVFNAYRKDLAFPEALFGYRVDLNNLPKFVWLMERIENEEHVLVLFPKRSGNLEEEVQKLKARGIERAWATPQIPFIVPMTASFVVSFLFGNLLLGLMSLFM